jgi:hypothetical protein
MSNALALALLLQLLIAVTTTSGAAGSAAGVDAAPTACAIASGNAVQADSNCQLDVSDLDAAAPTLQLQGRGGLPTVSLTGAPPAAQQQRGPGVSCVRSVWWLASLWCRHARTCLHTATAARGFMHHTLPDSLRAPRVATVLPPRPRPGVRSAVISNVILESLDSFPVHSIDLAHLLWPPLLVGADTAVTLHNVVLLHTLSPEQAPVAVSTLRGVVSDPVVQQNITNWSQNLYTVRRADIRVAGLLQQALLSVRVRRVASSSEQRTRTSSPSRLTVLDVAPLLLLACTRAPGLCLVCVRRQLVVGGPHMPRLRRVPALRSQQQQQCGREAGGAHHHA